MQQYRKNLGKVSLTTEGAWDRNKFYEILSIVYEEHTQHGFISRKAVPVGVDINNKEYWMPFNVSGYADNNTIILNQKESETTIKSYTLEEAIKSIASVGRKPGTILGFYNENTDRLDIGGRWELWQYNGVDIADWENVNSWDSIYYNYNKFAGWYRSEESLKKYIPFPEIGCYAYIGSDLNEAVIYHCDRKYVWTNTTEHVWDYIKVIVGGNVIVGENGNWYNNGVDTNIPASVKGENGKTPIIRNNNNILEISYDNVNWTKISDEMAAWFRINNNKLEMSRHEAGGWEVMSDYIAAWFRWQSQGGQQAFSTGKIQITRDGVTWTDLSGEFVNNLRISRYIGTSESLPTSGIAEGTIYAKGPYYEDGDTLHEYPAYRLWVYAWKGNTLAWVDNGQFTSIAAGIVQDTGNSENAVMSQKAVTEKLAELGSEVKNIYNEVFGYNLPNGLPEEYIDGRPGSSAWSNEGSCYIIPIKENNEIEIVSNSLSKSFWGLLSSFDKNNRQYTWVDGYVIHSMGVGSSTTITAPTTSKYIAVWSGDYTPSKIVVNGVNLMVPISKKGLSETQEKILKELNGTEIECEFLKGKYVTKGGVIANSSTTSWSGFMKVNMGDVVNFTSFAEFSFPLWYFETNSEEGKGIPLVDGTEYKDKSVIIEKSGYIVVTGRNNNSDYELKASVVNYMEDSMVSRIAKNTSRIENLEENIKMQSVYVDADDGNDDNNGNSWNEAFKTFEQALKFVENGGVVYFTGTSNETLNVTFDKLSIVGKVGAVNRIIKGTKISNAELISGNVYKSQLSEFPSFSEFFIYQFGVDDVNTIIEDSERHPLQKGKTYRCDCTKIVNATSIEDVINNDFLSYYWDGDSGVLYFKIAEGTILESNPIYIPNGDYAINIPYNQVQKEICISNISCYFGSILCKGTINTRVVDCFVGYSRSAGGIMYDGSINILIERCEVCGVFSGSGNGDGINAHRMTEGSAKAVKHTTANINGSWCHDVSDDGFSDHEGCESNINGCLFEYCGKSGCTPSYGSHCNVYNSISRKNYNGFFVTAEALDGDRHGEMICYNCMAIDNYHSNSKMGCGFKASHNNTAILYNCISVGNKSAYSADSEGSSIFAYNCYSYNCGKEKHGSGVFNALQGDAFKTA